jgi:RHS repeat-associated protein
MVAWNSVQTDSIFSYPGTESIAATDSVVTWIDGKRFRVFHKAPSAVAGIDLVTISSNTGVIFEDRTAFYSSSGFLDSLKIGATRYAFSPDADGTGGTETFPNGVTRTSHALTSHRIADVRFSNDNLTAPFRREYHFNLAGKIDQVMHDDLTSFTYDELGRLTSSSRQTGCFWGGHWPVDTVWGKYTYCTTPVWTQTYTYDAMGNRTNHGGVPTTGNRYIRFSGVDYSYDADGNVTQKYNPNYNRQFYWNAANQLDSVINNGSYRTAFDYDAFGRPVRIRGGNATGLQVTSYLLWDGDALLAELRPNGEREIDYVYLPGTIDRPFASTLGATAPIDVVFHEIDELGNVIGSHVNGSVSQSNSYDAWGAVTSFSPESRLFWKGLFWTGDSTSLYFMRNRWYDPEGERFLSEDPAGFAGGINLYAFAGNDPVNGRDPSGLDAGCTWVDLPDPWSRGADGAIIVHASGFWVCWREDAPEVPPSGGGGGGGWDGGGGGGGGSPAGTDAGSKAAEACRNSILLATGAAALDLTGGARLWDLGRGALAVYKVARFSSNFSYSVPANIVTYNRNRVFEGAAAFAGGFFQEWGKAAGFSYGAVTLAGLPHNLWAYVPFPGSGTFAAVADARRACFHPTG